LTASFVELARGLGLAREQRGLAALLECPKVPAAGPLADAEEAAYRAAAQPVPVREDSYRPVAVGQAAVVEAVEQGAEIGDITDIAAQRPRADVLLQHGAHPLERGLPGLFALTGLRGDVDHPTGVAEEPLRALGGYDRRISPRQQEEEVDRAPLVQRRQQIVRVFPDAAVIDRHRSGEILHRAVAAAEALLVADALVDDLHGQPGRRRQGGVFPEHPLDRGRVRPEFRVSPAPRSVWLRQRVVEHLTDGLPADARLANNLPDRGALPQNPVPDVGPLPCVAVHGWPSFRARCAPVSP
jgi:hypothetical protein